MVVASLQGLPLFLSYLCAGVALVAAYSLVYTRLTAHDEFGLIQSGNAAAALAFALNLIGFALPLSSAIAHSASLVDCLIWGIIALLVQVAAYLFARWRMSDVSDRIAKGDWAAALWLGGLSLTAGMLNAVSMAG